MTTPHSCHNAWHPVCTVPHNRPETQRGGYLPAMVGWTGVSRGEGCDRMPYIIRELVRGTRFRMNDSYGTNILERYRG
jgi:hypothetical protein